MLTASTLVIFCKLLTYFQENDLHQKDQENGHSFMFYRFIKDMKCIKSNPVAPGTPVQ
jgi:hypothetical protein